jgi:peptide/nickel transport system ATP-binding protein
MALLEVEHLVTRFELKSGAFSVVDGVSLKVDAGESIGLVGESGSGKSLTLKSIVRALPPKARIAHGQILYDGVNVAGLGRRRLQRLRGREIGMIFQDPISALNPVLTVGDQLMETFKLTAGVRGEGNRRARALDILRLVGVPEPDRRMSVYPYELSGGMAQRVVIALALIGEPKVLLADEPTSALDVTVQAQILSLLVDLRARFGMALVLVSHDFGVVAKTCGHVYVMYAGRVVEHAPVAELFSAPRHPYTIGLLASIPRLTPEPGRSELPAVPGSPPNLSSLPDGCRFHPRCPLAVDACRVSDVPLIAVTPRHEAACIRQSQVAARGELFAAREPTEAM